MAAGWPWRPARLSNGLGGQHTALAATAGATNGHGSHHRWTATMPAAFIYIYIYIRNVHTKKKGIVYSYFLINVYVLFIE
jgi:hypothetical protein